MRSNNASILPLFALLLTALLGLGGMAIDISHSYSTKTKVKNTKNNFPTDFKVKAIAKRCLKGQ